jgi:hypothetical protein
MKDAASSPAAQPQPQPQPQAQPQQAPANGPFTLLPTPEHDAQNETNGAVLVVMDEAGKVTQTVTRETIHEKKEIPPLPACASLFAPEEPTAQTTSASAEGMLCHVLLTYRVVASAWAPLVCGSTPHTWVVVRGAAETPGKRANGFSLPPPTPESAHVSPSPAARPDMLEVCMPCLPWPVHVPVRLGMERTTPDRIVLTVS